MAKGEGRARRCRGCPGQRPHALRDFLAAVRAEIGKVTWPTRDELVEATRVIHPASPCSSASLIGLLDWLLQKILIDGVAAICRGDRHGVPLVRDPDDGGPREQGPGAARAPHRGRPAAGGGEADPPGLVPTQEVVEIKNGKKVTVERKLYPGYVLVEMVMSQEALSTWSTASRA